MATSHLSWMIIRDNSSFLLKKRGVKKPFSTEPNNLSNLNSFRYNGLIHKKTIGIAPTSDKKGITVSYKKPKYHFKPGKSTATTTINSGPRRALFKLRRLILKNKYRRDLLKASLRRASAILTSQKKPAAVKKTRTKKTE